MIGIACIALLTAREGRRVPAHGVVEMAVAYVLVSCVLGVVCVLWAARL